MSSNDAATTDNGQDQSPPPPDPPSIELSVRFDMEKQAATPSFRVDGSANATQWAACLAAVLVSMDDAAHQLAAALRCDPQELAARAQALATPALQRAARARAARLILPNATTNGRIVH